MCCASRVGDSQPRTIPPQFQAVRHDADISCTIDPWLQNWERRRADASAHVAHMIFASKFDEQARVATPRSYTNTDTEHVPRYGQSKRPGRLDGLRCSASASKRTRPQHWPARRSTLSPCFRSSCLGDWCPLGRAVQSALLRLSLHRHDAEHASAVSISNQQHTSVSVTFDFCPVSLRPFALIRHPTLLSLDHDLRRTECTADRQSLLYRLTFQQHCLEYLNVLISWSRFSEYLRSPSQSFPALFHLDSTFSGNIDVYGCLPSIICRTDCKEFLEISTMLNLPTPPPSPQPKEYGATQPPTNRIGQILGDIKLTEVLGVGAYGTVYKACNVRDPRIEYAVKTLNKAGLDSRQKSFQEREIQLHYEASQSQAGVVEMMQILDSEECTFVVLEYCPEGDLFAKITEEDHYVGNDQKAKWVFLQILDAVKACHDKGIYHRDLKPENILVKDNGWTVKLADFGLATKERVTSDFGCGSTFYMSPGWSKYPFCAYPGHADASFTECQQTHSNVHACYASAPNDVWSLGVILVNLTCGRNPWKHTTMDDSTFRAFMRDRNFLQSILPITDELNYILQRIFEIDPQRRISISELIYLVSACTQFTHGTSNVSTPVTPVYTPPVEAVGRLCLDSAMAFVEPLSDVPTMELPRQQYPQTYTKDEYASSSTPSHTVHNSPHLSPYTHTYAAKHSAPPVCSPYASQFDIFQPLYTPFGKHLELAWGIGWMGYDVNRSFEHPEAALEALKYRALAVFGVLHEIDVSGLVQPPSSAVCHLD
nr:negative regulator of sexual conjugation and meiosis [Quercus suber]